MILDHIEGFSLILAFFVALVTVIFKMLDIRSSREKTNDYKRQFMETVSQLTSDNISARLAAAIVLRRFLDAGTKDSAYFRQAGECPGCHVPARTQGCGQMVGPLASDSVE